MYRRAVFAKEKKDFLPKFFYHIVMKKHRNKKFFLKFLISKEKKILIKSKSYSNFFFFFRLDIFNVQKKHPLSRFFFSHKIRFRIKLYLGLFYKIFHHENFFIDEVFHKIKGIQRFKSKEGVWRGREKKIFFFKLKTKIKPISCFLFLFFENSLIFRNPYFLFSLTDMLTSKFHFLNIDLFVLMTNFLSIYKTWIGNILYFNLRSKNSLFHFLEIIFYNDPTVSKKIYFNKINGLFFYYFLSNLNFFFSYSRTGYLFFYSILYLMRSYQKKHLRFHEFYGGKIAKKKKFTKFVDKFFFKKNFFSISYLEMLEDLFANISKYSHFCVKNFLLLQFFIQSLLEQKISPGTLEIFFEIFQKMRGENFLYIFNPHFLKNTLYIFLIYEKMEFFFKKAKIFLSLDFSLHFILNDDENIVYFKKNQIYRNFFLNFTNQCEKIFFSRKIGGKFFFLKFTKKKFFKLIHFFSSNSSYQKIVQKKVRFFQLRSILKGYLSEYLDFSCFLFKIRQILHFCAKDELKISPENEKKNFLEKTSMILKIGIIRKFLIVFSLFKTNEEGWEGGRNLKIFNFPLFSKPFFSFFSKKNFTLFLKFQLISIFMFTFFKKTRKLAYNNLEFFQLQNNSLYFQKLALDDSFLKKCSLSNCFFFFLRISKSVSFFFKSNLSVNYLFYEREKVADKHLSRNFYFSFLKELIFTTKISKKKKKKKIFRKIIYTLEILKKFINIMKIILREIFDHFFCGRKNYKKKKKSLGFLINSKKFHKRYIKKFFTLNSTKKSGFS